MRSLGLGAVALLFTLLLAPVPAAAQEMPPSEELDELKAQADTAPLFAGVSPVIVDLFVDLEYVKDKRPDEEEVAGLLRFETDDGPVDFPVEIRARGIFRRESRNCSFPPLRLDVPKGAVKGTVFGGQDKLKLVHPCREGRDSFQELVLTEYLAYRMLNLLTPASFRVRLLDLTIHDTSGQNDPVRSLSFVIEDGEQLAARNRAVEADWEQFHPEGMEVQQAVTSALFQFMIGNTDWEPALMHNAILLRDEDNRYLTVPYDFDFAGIVDAPYASPDPLLPIKDVRDRFYLGYCWEGADLEGARSRFLELRPQLEALWSGLEELPEGARRRGLDYLETFYRVLESPGAWRRQVVEACRGFPDWDA